MCGTTGGLDYARRRGDQFAREAEESLADLPDSPARNALVDAISLRGGATLVMARGVSKHRPMYHLLVLASGFVAGGVV